MAFSPTSRVYLLDTPLDNTHKNQLHFESKDAQINYFNSKIKHTFEDVTYQRKDNKISINKNIDSLWNVNYCMYQNANFTNKWFYAFITRMEYVNSNVTDVYIETDVYQSWLFDTQLKESFVVREHVSDDTIGKHLLDEQLDTGEYTIYNYHFSNKLGKNWNILAVSDNSPMTKYWELVIAEKYGNLISGLTYYPFPNTSQGIAWLKTTIDGYTSAGKADAIVMIFTVPELSIKGTIDSDEWMIGDPLNPDMPFDFSMYWDDKNLLTLDGYIPKNNKLFTHPYNFLNVSNTEGGNAVYNYEDFSGASASFIIISSVSPNPKVMLIPTNYKNTTANYEHALILSGFPLCSWVTDAYNAWLAQEGTSTAVSMITSGAVVAGGLITGNAFATIGGAMAIFHQLAQVQKASIQPDQAKGQIGNGNLRFADGTVDFSFSHMGVKYEYAKRIDDYLSMFGYRVNTLKVPNTHSREKWNYIQTIDVNIDGAIPSDDMNRLKKIYNDGVTLWHSPSDFLNYGNLINPIL